MKFRITFSKFGGDTPVKLLFEKQKMENQKALDMLSIMELGLA